MKHAAIIALSAAIFLSNGFHVEAKPEFRKEAVMEIKLTSSEFKDGEMIPIKYSGEGDDMSPPLEWSGLPAGTKSIAIVCDDPDAPYGNFVHWVIFNIPPSANSMPEGAPAEETLANGSRQGMTDFGKIGYGGPLPPRGVHRYFFTIYALDTMLELGSDAGKKDLLKEMEGHILAKGQLLGRYRR